MPTPKPKGTTASPLYTSLKSRLIKLAISEDWGRDTDGAYRTKNRLDGKDKRPAGESNL